MTDRQRSMIECELLSLFDAHARVADEQAETKIAQTAVDRVQERFDFAMESMQCEACRFHEEAIEEELDELSLLMD